jgi:hypothetical protein
LGGAREPTEVTPRLWQRRELEEAGASSATNASEMVWSYLEVIFTKSGPLHSQHWRVCIELNDTDETFLNSDTNTELRTQSVVLRSGILDLLPAGLENSWHRFGTMLEDNVIGTWRGGSDPIIAKDGHKVWIISRRIE